MLSTLLWELATRETNVAGVYGFLERREREGGLAPVEDLGDALRTVVLTLRSQALALPSKVAPRMVMLRTAGEAQRILVEEVHGWLQDLASARIVIRKTKPDPGWEDYVEYRDDLK